MKGRLKAPYTVDAETSPDSKNPTNFSGSYGSYGSYRDLEVETMIVYRYRTYVPLGGS